MAAQLMQNGTTLLRATNFSAACPTTYNVNGPISVEAQANTSSNVLVALVPRYAVLCAVLCCAVLCCAVLCCAVLCCAVLCCAVLCCGSERD